MTAERDGTAVSAIEVRGISKTFSGAYALDRVNLTVAPGEVHALLGANGSGKSTLIKVLAGFHRPDPGGQIRVFGETLEAGSARESHRAGLRFIHQDLGLIDDLTVAENFALVAGEQPRLSWTSLRKEASRVRDIFARFHVDIDPTATIANLSPTNRAIVAIVRAVADRIKGAGVVVLDEPTAALPSDEVHHLFRIISHLKEEGVTVIYVSHRMPEILEIADRLTVLRDGRTAATADVAGLDLETLVGLVLGYSLAPVTQRQQVSAGAVALDVTGLSGPGVRGLDLQGRVGEVVGITGVLGSGYEAVLALLFGAEDVRGGRIALHGKDITRVPIRERIRRGLAYAPLERRTIGAIMQWSVAENITLPAPPSRGPLKWMAPRDESRDVAGWMQDLNVVPNDSSRLFATLSGGNQQKVVIARWLRSKARVLLMDEPTNGVDASAKRTIHTTLRETARAGACVILASSDVEELVAVCDRVLVFGDGVIRAELAGEELRDESLNAAIMTTSRAAAPA